DATYGRRTRAVIITDSDHVILSAVQPETVAHRLAGRDPGGRDSREASGDDALAGEDRRKS
ncbi:MAG TPA: extracellular matrix/biofilm biosynthesis regulator RemA family protein, partial [Bacillota bacterium]